MRPTAQVTPAHPEAPGGRRRLSLLARTPSVIKRWKARRHSQLVVDACPDLPALSPVELVSVPTAESEAKPISHLSPNKPLPATYAKQASPSPTPLLVTPDDPDAPASPATPTHLASSGASSTHVSSPNSLHTPGAESLLSPILNRTESEGTRQPLSVAWDLSERPTRPRGWSVSHRDRSPAPHRIEAEELLAGASPQLPELDFVSRLKPTARQDGWLCTKPSVPPRSPPQPTG